MLPGTFSLATDDGTEARLRSLRVMRPSPSASRYLEKHGIRVRIMRKDLKEPIAKIRSHRFVHNECSGRSPCVEIEPVLRDIRQGYGVVWISSFRWHQPIQVHS